RQYHHFGILSRFAHAGEPRIALDFIDQGFGIRIGNVADAKADGMTEFRPTSAERAAHRTRADYRNFHVQLLRFSHGKPYQRPASSAACSIARAHASATWLTPRHLGDFLNTTGHL